MGTRGTLGFVIDGQSKVAYNHWDSYPDGLGLDVLRWLRTAIADSATLAEQARALRVVDSNSEPTDEDIERLSEFLNRSVGERRERPDWYQLLRETQGAPAAILRAGVVEDGSRYVGIEWEYRVDLDAGTFTAKDAYDSGDPTAWKLTDLPTDDEFVAALGDAG